MTTPEYSKTYYHNNRERLIEKQRAYRQRLKMEAIKALGCICVRCGFSDPRALQIDHVNGNGMAEEKIRKRAEKFYPMVVESVRKGEGKYQLLCANCNWIKRFECGEHT